MTTPPAPPSIHADTLAQILRGGFLEALPDPAWVKDTGLRYVAANAAFRKMCGFQVGGGDLAVADVIDTTDFSLFPLETAERVREEDLSLIAEPGARRGDLVLVSRAGVSRHYETFRTVLRDSQGAVIGSLGFATEVSAKVELHTHVRDNARRLTTLVQHLPVAAFQRSNDTQWSMAFISEGSRELTGYAPEEFFDNAVRTWGSIILPEDFERACYDFQGQLAAGTRYRLEYRIVRADGEERWVREWGVNIGAADGKAPALIGAIMDFTETRHYLDEMVRYDTHDALTGVANRPLLVDHLRHGIAYSERYKRMVATVVANVDHFKYVNQSLGHAAGDEALKLVANRLRGALRDHDSLARLGADSFAMTLIDVENSSAAALAMARLLIAVREPFKLGEQEIVVTCSAGCALYPADGADPETLLRHADTAMRHARNQGGDCYYFYSAEGDSRAEERLYLEGNLRRAVENGELMVHYQPQVAAGDGRFIGMEALLRWRHPEMGMVSPGRFIPVAEQTDLIVSIGAWVMEEACRQTRKLMDDGFHVGHVAVNLSARQFRDKHLIDKVGEILARTGLAPQHLELEITESLAMNDVDAVIAKLKALKALGLQLAIDDFGTGYSSLSYLRRFPIDRLKIDQSFTREVTASNDGAAIAHAVIQLGHALDLRVIAEGVETEDQLQFLRKNGCDEIQGYFFSRPLEMDALRKRLLTLERPAAAASGAPASVLFTPAEK